MIVLVKVIKYENANAIEATWFTREQLPDVNIPAQEALFDAGGKEVQSAVPAHTVPGDIVETVVRCHSYADSQMDMLRADLGADAAQYEDLIARVEAAIVPPAPPAAEVAEKIVAGKIDALWAAADRYTSGYISGVAVGILTIGVMQQMPKALAVAAWSSAIWAEYYARKARVTVDSADDHDFSGFGPIPHSVPELQAEVGQ